MKIFPTSSTLTDLVNYINAKTDSHQKVYDFLKNLIISSESNSSLTVDFTNNPQYINSRFPINDSGYINQPQDMFGGSVNVDNPIITTFNKTDTVPNIIDGKLTDKISVDGDIPNSISLTSPNMSQLSHSTYTKKEGIKYWPTIKINDFFPISSKVSEYEQDNVNGVSESDSLFSIIKLIPGKDEKYHHINIEYSPLDPKTVILMLLDGSNVADGDSLEFKLNFINTTSNVEANYWPIVIFLDSTYLNFSIENTFNLNTLATESQSLNIDGIRYKYVPAAILDSQLYKYLRVPNNDPIGYLVSIDTLDCSYLNSVGEHFILTFNGNANTITYNNYGYLDSEVLRIDNNSELLLVTRPVLGKNASNILEDSSIEFGKDVLRFVTRNNSCAVFGAQTNKYSYNMSGYSTGATLLSRKVVTDYLPIDYPKQLKKDIVNFNSEINSGLFFTFDVSSDLIGNNYFVLNTGLQFVDSFFSIRKHSSTMIIEIAGVMNTVAHVDSEFSVDVGYKRVTDKINKRILVRSSNALVFDSGWVADHDVDTYPCDLISLSSPFIENYQITDLDLTNSIGVVTISNVLFFNNLAKHEVDSLFNISILNGVYSRFNNITTTNPKVLPISQLEGLLTIVNQYPKSNVALLNVSQKNNNYSPVEFRIGFTVHENKGNFSYRNRKDPILGSSLLETVRLVDESKCGDFDENNTFASADCEGILNAQRLPYFSSGIVSNSASSVEAKSPYNSLILNKNTLISFGKCGYLPKVSTTTTYKYLMSHFTFDNGMLARFNPAWKTIQSFEIKKRVLSLPMTDISNTLNRVLFYFDQMQTINNQYTNLHEIFQTNFGSTVDIMGKVSDSAYKYTMVGADIPFEIRVPSANESNLETFVNTMWQIRYITKNINPATATFSDIDLDTDTVVFAELPFFVYRSVYGTYNFLIAFQSISTSTNVNFSAVPMQYLKNGYLITMKNEYDGPSVAIPTDGSNLYLYQGNRYYPSIELILERSVPVYDETITYDKAPIAPVPRFSDIQSLIPKGTIDFRTLNTEYIPSYEDFPTINRMMVSTFYQIPKYSK